MPHSVEQPWVHPELRRNTRHRPNAELMLPAKLLE
jgi:hypothetical protein